METKQTGKKGHINQSNKYIIITEFLGKEQLVSLYRVILLNYYKFNLS